MKNQSSDNSATPLGELTTELSDPALAELDSLDRLSRLQLMNAEDRKAADAVGHQLENISAAVSTIVRSFKSGGRLIYVGAGTSGRLGVLDASECPPTFGTDPALVTAIIAGGKGAMFEAVEGAEDDEEAGRQQMRDVTVQPHDTVVGISASGQAPFVVGALLEASSLGASTVAVVNNRRTKMESIVQVTIAPIVGPEFIAGSTRLKAGTAQKLVLNMLTTNAMIEIGKTYGNRMVDVRATNSKLRARALRITRDVTGSPTEECETALVAAGGSVKIAILMIETGLSAEQASALLIKKDGFLRKALHTNRY